MKGSRSAVRGVNDEEGDSLLDCRVDGNGASTSWALHEPTRPGRKEGEEGRSSEGEGSPYWEHDVTRSDTLAGIALHYGVRAGDIKLANGLYGDADIHCRKTLRVPHPGVDPTSVRRRAHKRRQGKVTFAIQALRSYYETDEAIELRGRRLDEVISSTGHSSSCHSLCSPVGLAGSSSRQSSSPGTRVRAVRSCPVTLYSNFGANASLSILA